MLYTSRYIHLNPIRANIVKKPEKYALLEQGAEIYAYDPVGRDNFKRRFPEGKNGQGTIKYVENVEEAGVEYYSIGR